MVVPYKIHTHRPYTHGDNEISCRKAFCMSQNMLTASKSKNLIGETLMARPETLLSPDGDNHFKLEQHTEQHSRFEDQQDDLQFIHSPMLYVTNEYTKDGVVLCDLIILNGPLSANKKLKDYVGYVPQHLEKHPVFLSAHQAMVSCTEAHDISLLVARQNDQKTSLYCSHFGSAFFQNKSPYQIIHGREAVSDYLERCNASTCALAFQGQFTMPKAELMQHVGMGNLYFADNLPPDIALSPYPESKYIQAFDKSGYNLRDLGCMAKWAKDIKTASTRHLN
jgi:hypothetical protein